MPTFTGTNREFKRYIGPRLRNLVQVITKKHKAAGNGFGFGLVIGKDVTRTLSARYHKDGSEILIAQNGGRVPRRLRFAENGRAMLRKKRQLRRRGIIGKGAYSGHQGLSGGHETFGRRLLDCCFDLLHQLLARFRSASGNQDISRIVRHFYEQI